MKIRLTINDKTVTATLNNGKTTQDFVSMLPLTLTLEDYAGTEKISYLPRKLSTRESSEGCHAASGDITYYSPWGNLAIFYRDHHGFARGLINLGKIDGDIESLKISNPFNVTIELIK